MKYYLCQVNGVRTLETVQTEAKRIDPSYETVEIPTDKAGLKAYIEVLFAQIDQQASSPPENAPEASEQPTESPPAKPAKEATKTWQQQREEQIQRKIDLDEAVQNAPYDEARGIANAANQRMVELEVERRLGMEIERRARDEAA